MIGMASHRFIENLSLIQNGFPIFIMQVYESEFFSFNRFLEISDNSGLLTPNS